MHIGTGEKHATKKRAQTGNVEPIEKKDTKRQKTDNSVVDTSELLAAATTGWAVDTQKLLAAAAVGPQKQHHYKLYRGDHICTTLEVGEIWSMTINGKESCGITLKARHMVILSRNGEQPKEEIVDESDVELPGMGVFD